MNGYLLDTNACIGWLKRHPAIVRRVIEAGEGRVFLCGTVKSELWFGACNSQRPDANKAKLREFFAVPPSLAFDDAVVEHYGEIRAFLARSGQMIGPFDLQIAAFARAHACSVVTHNIREFCRVPKLLFEDWEAEQH